MKRITMAQFRARFSETLDRVAQRKERLVVTRRGKKLAAFLPMEDFEYLMGVYAEEDAEDVKAARKALAEFKKSGGKAIPLEEARKRLGLAR